MSGFSIGFKVSLPKDMSKFDGAAYIGRMARAQLNQSIPQLTTLFEQTVTGWEHRPIFKSTQTISSDSIRISVFPSGPYAEQYALVSHGARPHMITPRQGKLLRFQPGYRAATSPRMLSSRSKQRYGNFVKASVVHHPGFEGREFSETIKEVYDPIFVADMQSAMKP